SYVEKCRQEIENIILEGTDVIPKEVLNEFNEQSDNISGELRSNTTSMQELSSVISENEYAIERAQNEIEENEKEIKEKEDKIKSLQNKDDEASKQEIETLNEEIGALNSKISELNSIITNANKNIDTANNEYEEYSSKNTSLSEEQSGLMEKCMNKYYEAHTEEDRVYEDSFLKGQIEGLEDCISNAEINLSENTLNLTTEIENLKIQLAKKELEALISAQSAAASGASGTSYSITGGNYTGDLPVNNELASIAQATASSMGSTGWCLKGVNNALEKAYGFRLSYNSAYQAIPALQSRSDFTEVTNQYPSAQSLTNLPAGAIVVWENSSNHPHGHISIALGNGQEASDHIQSQTVNYGTQYHVFVKTA
ncbi:TPA: hypothetical protein IAA82_01805, partial [Candidatus Galligastranaerophilus gallistercoris]|nr:hypothetical protein [Candidatus Galligastranaerophilus gallistercoris]